MGINHGLGPDSAPFSVSPPEQICNELNLTFFICMTRITSLGPIMRIKCNFVYVVLGKE